jgi:hypothetical protein
MKTLKRFLAKLPQYRKAVAASLPLVVEIAGQLFGVNTPLYVKILSAVGVVAVIVSPKNDTAPVS